MADRTGWPDHRAAPGFSDRVMARLGASRASPRSARRAAAVGFALGVVVASLATLSIAPDRRVRRARERPAAAHAAAAAGTLSPAERTQARLGDAAVAVIEPGATLRWQTRAGHVEVEQSAGRVFYRSDDALRVRTRWGELDVTGTSFSVSTGATRTEIVVYDGRVAVASGAASAVVAAGRRLSLTRRGIGAEQPAAWLAGDEPTPDAPGKAAVALRATSDTCACAADENVFEPGAATLAAWAASCRLSFDVAPMGYDAASLEPYLDQLGLTAEERPVLREIIASVEARANRELQRLYGDATGDDASVDRVSLDWMFDQVLRSADADEPAQLRRKLARERAGLAPAPTDLRQVTPYEELVRSLERSGDDLEQAIAARLGARRARELRARNGGWPGLRWNVAGCPTE